MSKHIKYLKLNQGYTLVELIVAIGIMTVMFSIGTIALSNISHKSTLDATVNTFMADFKEQQIKAMVGDGEGTGSASNYGIFFGTNTYTMFRNTFGTSDFAVPLSNSIVFTNPGTQIIFEKGTGVTTPTTITLKDTIDNNQKSIIINRYGVITQVN